MTDDSKGVIICSYHEMFFHLRLFKTDIIIIIFLFIIYIYIILFIFLK